MQSYEALYSLILQGFYPITSLPSCEGTCPRIAVAQWQWPDTGRYEEPGTADPRSDYRLHIPGLLNSC